LLNCYIIADVITLI